MITKIKDIRNIDVENKIDDDYTRITFSTLNDTFEIEIHKSKQRQFVRQLVKNLLEKKWEINLNEFIS